MRCAPLLRLSSLNGAALLACLFLILLLVGTSLLIPPNDPRLDPAPPSRSASKDARREAARRARRAKLRSALRRGVETRKCAPRRGDERESACPALPPHRSRAPPVQ